MNGGESGRDILDERAQVMLVESGSGGAYHALLSSPGIARKAKPMQFVQVKVRAGNDPFLRRPFSLSKIDPEAGLIGITWTVVGGGTEIMSGWEPGMEVMVLGPLGNGFVPWDRAGALSGALSGDRPRRPRMLLLLGGGTGVAPMYPVAAAAKARGWDVALFYGARTAHLLMDTSQFELLGCSVRTATEDGSAGVRGFVTHAASPLLNGAAPGDLAVACGPKPMLKAVKDLCGRAGVDLYVSLEERMACGTGLCRGCAVKASGPEVKYLHICLEGPVFRANDIDLGGEA